MCAQNMGVPNAVVSLMCAAIPEGGFPYRHTVNRRPSAETVIQRFVLRPGLLGELQYRVVAWCQLAQ